MKEITKIGANKAREISDEVNLRNITYDKQQVTKLVNKAYSKILKAASKGRCGCMVFLWFGNTIFVLEEAKIILQQDGYDVVIWDEELYIRW